MSTKGGKIELTVSKWGNSLAVRLPGKSARAIGVGGGDTLIAEVSREGRLVLSPEGRAVDKAEARRLRRLLERQKVTVPVAEEMRGSARY